VAGGYNINCAQTAPTGTGINGAWGVVQNSNSGLIAAPSGITLGTIPSEKLGGFYIRY